MNLRLLLPALLLALTTAFSAAAQQRPTPQKVEHQQTTQRNYGNTNKNVAPIPDIPGLQKGGRPNYGGCDAYDATVGTPGCGTVVEQPICRTRGAINYGQPMFTANDCQCPTGYVEKRGRIGIGGRRENRCVKVDEPLVCKDTNASNHNRVINTPNGCVCKEGYAKDPATGLCVVPPIAIPPPGLTDLKVGLTSAMWSKRSGSNPTSSHGYRKREERFTQGDGMFWHYGRKKTSFKIAWSVGSSIGTYRQEDLNQVMKFPGPPVTARCPPGFYPYKTPGGLRCAIDTNEDWQDEDFDDLYDEVPQPQPDPMYTFSQEHAFQWSGACNSNGPICIQRFDQNTADKTATLTVTNKATGQVVFQQSVTVKRYGAPSGGGGGGRSPDQRYYIM